MCLTFRSVDFIKEVKRNKGESQRFKMVKRYMFTSKIRLSSTITEFSISERRVECKNGPFKI